MITRAKLFAALKLSGEIILDNTDKIKFKYLLLQRVVHVIHVISAQSSY